MKQYSPISVLVRSGDNWRVFITKSFSIRPITNYLQRFNPNFQIVYVRYGYFPTEIRPSNTGWTLMTDEEVMTMIDIVVEDEMFDPIPSVSNLKEYLLSNYEYRTALSMYYINCTNEGIYPSKAPFVGVKCESVPADIYGLVGDCDRLFYIADHQIPLDNACDILKWYEGKRIERRINGVMVQGYLLSAPRFKADEDGGRQ